MHTMHVNGKPDTLYLDPKGIYDVEIFTTPPIIKEKFELKPGQHNTLNFRVVLGTLNFPNKNETVYSVRFPNQQKVQYHDALKDKVFIARPYDIDVLTTPYMLDDAMNLQTRRKNEIDIPNSGTLSVQVDKEVSLSILLDNASKVVLIKDIGFVTSNFEMQLQPGKYKAVYLSSTSTDSDRTKTLTFEIFSDNKTSIVLK